MASSAGIDSQAGRSSPPGRGWIGPLCAVTGVLGFSGKAILVKMVYLTAPVDPTTLLMLRMLYSAPLFAATWARMLAGRILHPTQEDRHRAEERTD